MYGIAILPLFAALGAAIPFDLGYDDNRIVGGYSASILEFPYQVSLQVLGRHFCGGSILDETHVMTAGHCLSGKSTTFVTVRAGSNLTYAGGSVHKVKWAKAHETFSLTNVPQSDIGVLEVYPPFILDETRQVLPLSEESPKEGDYVSITGFGRLFEGGFTSQGLMAVEVPVTNHDQCSETYVSLGLSTVGDDFFCAGFDKGGRDSCQGDSGGPVAMNGKLVGIVSYGIGCARPKIPGVYTKVSYFNDWVKQTLKANKEE